MSLSRLVWSVILQRQRERPPARRRRVRRIHCMAANALSFFRSSSSARASGEGGRDEAPATAPTQPAQKKAFTCVFGDKQFLYHATVFVKVGRPRVRRNPICVWVNFDTGCQRTHHAPSRCRRRCREGQRGAHHRRPAHAIGVCGRSAVE